jgi:hypothetical protein
VKLPGRIGSADDPRVIGIFRNNKRKAFVELGGGGAMGKRTLVGRVSGALPFSDMNDAERTSGKTCGTERDASKRRQQHPRHFHHDNIPARIATERMLSQVVSQNRTIGANKQRLNIHELGSKINELNSPHSI